MKFPAALISRNVAVIFITTFIMGIVSSFSGWFLPIYLERYGSLEFVIIVYTFANLIAILPVFAGGILSDILGRKTLVLISTLLYVVSFVALLLTVSFVIVSSAIIMLLAGALIYTPLTALLGESVNSNRVGTVFSYYRFFSSVAASIGSFVLGYVSTYMSIRELIIFCILTSISCLALRFFLRETSAKRDCAETLKETLNLLKHVGHVFKSTLHMKILGVAIVVVGIGGSILSIYFPLFLSNSIGFSDMEVGVVFAISNLVSTVAFTFVGFFVDRLGWLKSFVIALSTEGILMFVLFIVSVFTLPKTVALLITLSMYASLSIFSAFDQVAGDRMLMDITCKETRGAIMASLASLSLLSKVPAPLLGVAIASERGFQTSIAMASASYLVGALLILILRRVTRGTRRVLEG